VSSDADAGPFTVTVSAASGGINASIDLDVSAHVVHPGYPDILSVRVDGKNHKPKPTGTVTFTDNGAPITHCTSLALWDAYVTCRVVYSGVTGSPHHIVASYSGDATYKPATGTATIKVEKISTDLRLTASKNPITAGSQVTYRVTVLPDGGSYGPGLTGTVTFTDGGVVIAGCGAVTLNPNGPTTCTVTYTKASGKQRHIVASFSGNDAYEPSSCGLTETIK
jgi:hypothetical protein